MQFVVSSTPVTDPSAVPASLCTVPFPPPTTQAPNHHLLFERKNGEWKINGVGFNEADKRVLANVPRGTVEVWELENGGGGWSHPIHVHLVDFKVLTGLCTEYEAQGLKDVVWLAPGETVTVEAHYAPWDGVYMFHCHNLIHEDHEMMAAFNVTALPDLGYSETDFRDPMEGRWRAEAVDPSKFTPSAITTKVQFMASLQPYNNVAEVFQKLDEYWSTHNPPTAESGLYQRR
ncbi:Cupredoxin [Diplogelasinospora grovesii]|uniref:Cupredoxin n=1 Tax=Diplogelasinospora grovesii TaxID=303347 RepID=A0AAN6N5Y9_9PEZI|nr:Cupredoxin [Diplogelasinospora grovesii]